MASRWMSISRDSHHFQIHTDTTDYFRVEYGDVVLLGGKPYLIRHNAKEGRFGLDDEVKFWVKRAIDLNKGFDPNDIRVQSTLRYCPSLSECILEEQNKTQYSTIVIGRQGLSRSEEFLFGSISSKIVNHARNCTVWVVE